MNTPVSFETVKLLNTKDWKFPYTIEYLEEIEHTNRYFESIPTIAEVIMWLYEKHGIWIEVRKHTRNGLRCFSPYIDNTPVKKDVFFNDYDSPTEAYETAIKYTLNNLI